MNHSWDLRKKTSGTIFDTLLLLIERVLRIFGTLKMLLFQKILLQFGGKTPILCTQGAFLVILRMLLLLYSLDPPSLWKHGNRPDRSVQKRMYEEGMPQKIKPCLIRATLKSNFGSRL